MSGPAPATSKIVARHGIAWMGGGSGSEVYGCAGGNRATGTEGEPFAAAHFRHVAELVEQAALAPSGAATRAARPPACTGSAAFGWYAVASRTGCADAAARGVASPCARNGSGRNGCRCSRRFLGVMSRE